MLVTSSVPSLQHLRHHAELTSQKPQNIFLVVRFDENGTMGDFGPLPVMAVPDRHKGHVQISNQTSDEDGGSMSYDGKPNIDYDWLAEQLDEIKKRRCLSSDNQLAKALRGGKGRAPSVIRDIRKRQGQPRPDTLSDLAELAGDIDYREWLERAGHTRPQLSCVTQNQTLEQADPFIRDVDLMLRRYNPDQRGKDMARELLHVIWSRRSSDEQVLNVSRAIELTL